MNRLALSVLAAATICAGLAHAEEKTTVYKSKGASGENVYSQLEVEGAKAQTVGTRKPVAASSEAGTETEKTDVQRACERGRENVALIESGKILQHDKDGDGVLQDLTAAEREEELAQAKRQILAYCAPEEEE
ncbi:MAG: hypothetical protein CL625_04000 [Arenimonas sp.]|jgi:hypothetical protein|nr:hypothetical protein [Arenimonas sp.]